MLKEQTLFGKINKVKKSIERLRAFKPQEGYHLAFSGGKDSIVIKALANMAKVKYDIHYNVTTIDPPELIYYMRKYHSDVIWDFPKKPFLVELVYRGFPQRQRRWCCEEYKERGGSGRVVMTGIRKAESSNRAKRKLVESCYKDTTKRYLNPIIDWTDSEVWEFIRKNNLPYCKLYDEGWKRIGCLFCPFATSHRKVEVELYPGYANAFRRAFQKLYDYKKNRGLKSVDRWKNGYDMFNWWINENRTKKQPDQMVMFE